MMVGYRSSMHSPYEFPLPYLGELVGWYKINEGSGITIYNSASPTESAQKFPHLTLYGATSYFWTALPGFGTCGQGVDKAYCHWMDADALNNTGDNLTAMSFFMRFVGKNETYPTMFSGSSVAAANPNPDSFSFNMSLYGSGWDYYLGANVDGTVLATGDRAGGPIYYDEQIDRWLFYFVYYDPSVNKYGMAYVKDDGTIIIPGIQYYSGGSQYPIKTIQLYRAYSQTFGDTFYIYGQLGDVMYWRSRRLLLSEYAGVYDQLKGRYGMAGRSGW